MPVGVHGLQGPRGDGGLTRVPRRCSRCGLGCDRTSKVERCRWGSAGARLPLAQPAFGSPLQWGGPGGIRAHGLGRRPARKALARSMPVLLLMAGSASAGSGVPWHTALTCTSTARAWMGDGTTPRALQAVGTGLPLNRPGRDALPVGLGYSVADDGSRGAFTDTPQHGFGCRRSTRHWRGQCPQGAVPH